MYATYLVSAKRAFLKWKLHFRTCFDCLVEGKHIAMRPFGGHLSF